MKIMAKMWQREMASWRRRQRQLRRNNRENGKENRIWRIVKAAKAYQLGEEITMKYSVHMSSKSIIQPAKKIINEISVRKWRYQPGYL